MRSFWLSLPLLALVPSLISAQKSATPSVAAVKFRSGERSVDAFLVRPAGPGPFPAVVMVHGDFGLNDWVKQQARRLGEKGHVVLAVDLYDGELPKDIEAAHILERGLAEDRVLADVKAAVDYLTQLSEVRKGPVGALGWDCGGGFALDAAIHDPRVKAVAMCYGRVITDPKRLAPLQANVLALYGGKDESFTAATIEQFRKALQQAGKSATVHVYPQAGSSFMEPDSPYFDGAPDRNVIADAWAKIEAHLAKELKK
jgi:carboxymethylenebutenolidase